MLVYGRNSAEEILKFPEKVQKIILQDGFDDKKINCLIEKNKFNVKYLSKKEIDRLVDGVHQGIIVYVTDFQYKSLHEVINDKSNFIVILDHLEDPHNLGAIIRTCEAAGVQAVIIPKDRQVQVTSTVIKTSVGTVFTLPIVQVNNLVNTIKKLKDNGFWIVGTALEDSVDYRKIDYSGKIALIIGNEGKGLSSLVLKACDFVASIPMYGKTNSLNASVASGIMIYEVVRNRK